MEIESTLAKGYYGHYNMSSWQSQVQNRLLNSNQCSKIECPLKWYHSPLNKLVRGRGSLWIIGSELNVESTNIRSRPRAASELRAVLGSTACTTGTTICHAETWVYTLSENMECSLRPIFKHINSTLYIYEHCCPIKVHELRTWVDYILIRDMQYCANVTMLSKDDFKNQKI